MTSVALRLAQSLNGRQHPAAARAVLAAALLWRPRDPGLLRELVAVSMAQRDARRLMAACRRLLAVCPDDVHAIETLASLELAAGNVDVARALLARRRTGGTVLRLATSTFIDPERANRGEVYVATLREVDVETADWSILDGDRVYNSEAHNRGLRKSPLVQGRASPDNKTFLFRLPPVARVIDGPCVHLGGDHNYCHWITRNLLKLALLEATPHENLPLLVNEDLRAYQCEYLELLGIAEERLIRLPRPALVHCSELMVPTSLANHLKMGVGIQWLRRRLARCMDPGPPTDLLFVSRRDAVVRRLVNEDEFEAALHALGFATLVPGEVSVREQILRFSRARVIVGAHGAAFGNLVFAPPGARVLEINSTYKSHIPDFVVLARAAGLSFSSVISDDYDYTRAEKYWPDTDFRADVDEVMAALRRVEPDLFG